MAIDKSNTQPWVKVVIVVVALSFVVAFIPGLFSALSDSGRQNANSAKGTGQVELAAQEYAPRIAQFKGVLASDPESYTVLVALGNAYFDWGQAVQQTSPESGASGPMWESATIYYARALSVQPGDPGVGTDLAISYFYAGRTDDAIAAVEEVLAKSPDFAAGLYNAGIFYQTAGRNAEGIVALERYIAVDPQGASGQLDRAKQMLTQMQQGSVTTSPGPSGQTTP